MLYERRSTRPYGALGLHHRLLLPHRGPKHTGHVVRQRGHLSGMRSAVLSHSRSQTPFPSKWPGLPPAGINYARITASSAVTCFLAWLGVSPTIPSDSTHVFRPHLQVTGSNSTQRFSPNSPGERVVGAPGFDPLSSDFAVERANHSANAVPLSITITKYQNIPYAEMI